MKKRLLILSLLFITGCIGFNEEKKEPKKIVERVNIEEKENIINNIEHYTKKQLEVKQYFDEYLERLSSLDTEGVIYMTYPKLFIPINKTIFEQYINNILNSPQIAIESYDTNITEIGEVYPYDNGEFAHLKYKATIKLAFINPNLYSDELSIRILNDILSRKYGQENIKIDQQNRVITIIEEQKLLAIKDNDSSDGEWKFIGDNPEYRKLYPEILPTNILSQI